MQPLTAQNGPPPSIANTADALVASGSPAARVQVPVERVGQLALFPGLQPVEQPTQVAPAEQAEPAASVPDIGADAAITAIVRAEGNLNVAAERLRKTTPGFTKADLLQVITLDPEGFRKLADQLRVLQLLRSFHLLKTIEDAAVSIMEDMEASDLNKLHSNVATLFGSLTQQASKQPAVNVNNNIDFTSVMLSALPPEVRQAFLALVEPEQGITNDIIPLAIGLEGRRQQGMAEGTDD